MINPVVQIVPPPTPIEQPAEASDVVPYTWFKNLTLRQAEAVKNSLTLSSGQFYLIQGPPGTGKSATLLAIIDGIWKVGKNAIVVTESDSALDHLLKLFVEIGVRKKFSSSLSRLEKEKVMERIKKRQSEVCRFGQKWTTTQECQRFLFEELVRKRYVQKDFDENLSHQAKKRKISKEVLKNKKIVFTTLRAFENQTQRSYLQDMKFDYCIFDEACQCNLSNSEKSLDIAQRLILAGDQKQLGVNETHPKASANSKLSLFEKMVLQKDKLPPGSKKVFSMLDLQFRMNSELMDISRNLFYDGQLKDEEKVKSICLKDLEKLSAGTKLIPLDRPLIWIDNPRFESVPRKTQYVNVYEQMIIAKLVIELVCHMKVQPDQIGVICGYNNQRNYVKTLLKNIEREELHNSGLTEIKISTIDSFQGQEREVIIFATTRSNENQSIGFLSDPKRFNVSVTRAKRLLIVIGNIETLKMNNHYCRLYSQAGEKGGLFEGIVDIEKIKQKMIQLEGKSAGKQRSRQRSNESTNLYNPKQFDLALNGRLYQFGKQVITRTSDLKVTLTKQQPKLLKIAAPGPSDHYPDEAIDSPSPEDEDFQGRGRRDRGRE